MFISRSIHVAIKKGENAFKGIVSMVALCTLPTKIMLM